MKTKHIAILLGLFAMAIAGWQVVYRIGFGKGALIGLGQDARRPLLTQKGAKISAVKPLPIAKKDNGATSKRRDSAAKDCLVSRFPGLDPNIKWDGIYRDEDEKAYPPKEQEFMAKVEKAIANDDVEMIRSLAGIAIKSQNKEVRESVVDALGFFGADVIVELASYLSDRDEDVADSAKFNWMDALQELNDDGQIAGVVESTLKLLRNKNLIEEITNELIGIDELAAIQVLVDVIEGTEMTSRAAKKVAKEVYDSITGEDWRGIDAAEKWLQENYESDEGN